jgi:predicted nucleic-acid-binding Zn-ribbon protein
MRIEKKCPKCGGTDFIAQIPTNQVLEFYINVDEDGNVESLGDVLDTRDGMCDDKVKNINYIYCEKCDKELYSLFKDKLQTTEEIKGLLEWLLYV